MNFSVGMRWAKSFHLVYTLLLNVATEGREGGREGGRGGERKRFAKLPITVAIYVSSTGT